MRSGLEIIETGPTDSAASCKPTPAWRSCRAEPCSNNVAAIIRRAAALETRRPIVVGDGPDLTANLDAAQIEQVLINLFKNAVEAVLETDGGVRVSWRQQGTSLEVRIEDDGPGLANTANLFVPFFTTKPSGSGIGLLLCRQIAENHGGSLSLKNREGATGCVATLRLPV